MTVYGKDPASPSGLVLPRSAFDSRPERNVGMETIDEELPAVPDRLLIATLVELGMPHWAADQLRHSPQLRFLGLKVWCDVQDAAEGDKPAQERVDYYRWCYQEQRREQIIADEPSETVGIFER